MHCELRERERERLARTETKIERWMRRMELIIEKNTTVIPVGVDAVVVLAGSKEAGRCIEPGCLNSMEKDHSPTGWHAGPPRPAP